jgi:two-component system, chemotaxis family, sensor kinase CheA
MAGSSALRDTFFEECEDLLAALAEGLAAMQTGSLDSETVNAVFRAVHSIKGGAGAFGLDDLVGFAHGFETVLDAVRSARLDADADVLHVLQRSADHLTDLVELARDGGNGDADITARFLEQLQECMGEGESLAFPADDAFEFAPIVLDFADAPLDESIGAVSGDTDGLTIRFRPHAALYANGHEPGLLIAALSELGPLDVRLDLSGLPPWGSSDPDHPHLAWVIRTPKDVSRAAISTVFEFVEGLCDLDFESANTPENSVVRLPEVQVQAPEPEPTVPAQAKKPAASAPSSEVKVASDQAGPQATLRVGLERVDRLINAVGELIINQAMVAQCIEDSVLATDGEVSAHIEDYRLLARDLQEAVMAIRAQPVKPLFQRMSRIVREAAEATGKQVQLVTHGESAEVDKTLIERLADPLTHMIRNAVDHGLESPETRIMAGKDATGTIRLSAAHRSGSVILTIRDDGAGLNRPRILDIARKKGLVPLDSELSDAEIDALLFMPGFSTASTVSNLSGRGVGLDVVRNAVMALGGRIAISSVPGKGTEFTLSLPLTLAVMDGMVITVADQTLVIPTTSVLETIRPSAQDLHQIGTGEVLLLVRGMFIPTVHVGQSLGFGAYADQKPPLMVLVETENQSQCALMVDAVHEQRQVVIKALDTNYGSVPGVSAATVLGDGRIALILDVDAIAAHRVSPVTMKLNPPLASDGAVHA